MSYSIIIGTANRTTLLIAGTLSYTLQANHDDTASCALLTTAAGFIPAVGQSFYVYESVDAENKFGGVINTVVIEKLEAGVSTSKALRVEMTISPFKAIASRRTVAYSETSVTAKAIVQKVISALSTDGVTEGTVNTGASDIGEYDAPLNTCSQVMDDMCTASQYQWWIDPDKLLHFYNFDLVISAPYTVTETGNYTVDSYSYDIDQYANKIFVQGHPDVSAVITRQDTAEQTARAAIEGGSGVYGATIIDENIVTATDANAAGDAALKWMGIIPQKLIFTAYDNLSSWYPAFRVTANLPSIGLTANTTFSIDRVTTSDQGTYFQAQVECSIRKPADFSTAQAQTGIQFLGKLVNNANGTNVSINETTGAITPVVKGGVVQVWVDTALSTLAKNNDVFVDTDDYSRYDMTAYSTTGTVTSANGEFIELTGTAACTLTITSPGTAVGTCTKYIKNSSSQSWTIGATVDGTANYTLVANLGVSLYWNNTDWRAFASANLISLGVTATATELNILDGATLTVTELNYVDGVTSSIQTQLNAKQASMGADDNYVTDAQLVVIGNTSGTNTGDNATNSQYSGLAASKADVAQTMYIGTNAHAINRASAAEGLAGITSLVPGANFTLAQNSVNVLTSENTGAIANTLYLKAGKVGIINSNPQTLLSVNVPFVQDVLDPIVTGQSGSTVLAGLYGIHDGPTTVYGLVFKTYKADVGLIEVVRIDNAGNVGIGTTSPGASLDIHNTSDKIGIQVQGYSTQTSNLQEWLSSAPTVLSHINANGTLDIGIATGTAPLVIASTTVVPNLNADLHDGLHSTDIPNIKTTVSLTAQVADIVSTNASNCNVAGLYRVSYYLVDTVADLTAGAVTLTIGYTDAGGAKTINSTPVALTAVTAFTQGTMFVQLASGSVAYSMTHTGLFGTAKYDLYMTFERIL